MSTDSSVAVLLPSHADSVVSTSAVSRPSDTKEFSNKDLPLLPYVLPYEIPDFNKRFVSSIIDFVGRSAIPWTASKDIGLDLINSLWKWIFKNNTFTIENSGRNVVYSTVR